MFRDDTLAGVDSRIADTDRLTTHYLESGNTDQSGTGEEGQTVIFLHGNVSSSRFFEDVMAALPARHRAIAPDLRGYGDSETGPVDATTGLDDYGDDIHALVAELELETPFVLVGWSNGGGVAMRYAIDHPEDVAALVLVNPLSPYGFGGTKDVDGTPCFDDYAGSGGGMGNDAFVAGLADRDRSEEDQASPRKVLRTYYVDPTHEFDPNREESYLTGMLDTATGDENYPGSSTPSDNWPGVAPGELGVNNAISPKYCDLEAITEIDPDDKPPVLWLRGDSDQIVSNASLFDLGTLGRMGELPDWPGEDVFPPQPMVDQTRAVLERYADRGGAYEEVVFSNVGHTPHVEVPNDFLEQITGVLE
ncbi:alpha/beta hydrolase [Natrinema hispanicum]|uniref:Pimeloyl-ACP methyl ester carboxylesterase n=1 Tax=Natrinema hispanicum TaxID=392421 RepID=A0A1H9ZMI9_9EURY|nr:alpha/beta hydrolase [Natrinema hispanicum]SDC08540.1 Pimeloyl-ACP methyl ester carboxylesterase [Natrinema hispanicum]SES82887.1 Pimeloyl-ACP methyl ester carboxylesterase [Natrinema hispanicum]